MTNRKANRNQIKIVSRRGHIRPTVKHGWLDLDGWEAVVVIAIILAVRITVVITRLAWRFLVWLTPIVIRYATGLVLWFRAFYTH